MQTQEMTSGNMGKGLIIAAPGSGNGKTLVTAGLAKLLIESGKTVRVYKLGPDYLDPQFLEHACEVEVRQLDYWMLGREGVMAELARGFAACDYLMIEGAMGLYDGRHPAAEVARDTGLPVMVVADASGMVQTFGALMTGLSSYDPEVNVAAVLANRLGSQRHSDMLAESVRAPLVYVGGILRDEALKVNERHLGVDHARAKPASSAMAEALRPCLNNIPWGDCPPLLQSEPAPGQGRLAGKRIAIARDAAFSFIYRANLDFLEREGASLSFFSPIADSVLPDCDALYLPGGYPELHLEALANKPMRAAIKAHIDADKPCFAECGGMLYLQSELANGEDSAAMLGVFPHKATLGKRLAALGYQALAGTSLRGHTFHYASLENDEGGERSEFDDGRRGEQIFYYQSTVASFVHWYFSSDPDRISAWLRGGQ